MVSFYWAAHEQHGAVKNVEHEFFFCIYFLNWILFESQQLRELRENVLQEYPSQNMNRTFLTLQELLKSDNDLFRVAIPRVQRSQCNFLPSWNTWIILSPSWHMFLILAVCFFICALPVSYNAYDFSKTSKDISCSYLHIGISMIYNNCLLRMICSQNSTFYACSFNVTVEQLRYFARLVPFLRVRCAGLKVTQRTLWLHCSQPKVVWYIFHVWNITRLYPLTEK